MFDVFVAFCSFVFRRRSANRAWTPNISRFRPRVRHDVVNLFWSAARIYFLIHCRTNLMKPPLAIHTRTHMLYYMYTHTPHASSSRNTKLQYLDRSTRNCGEPTYYYYRARSSLCSEWYKRIKKRNKFFARTFAVFTNIVGSFFSFQYTGNHFRYTTLVITYYIVL